MGGVVEKILLFSQRSFVFCPQECNILKLRKTVYEVV